MDEILADFIAETAELLAAAEAGLVALDGNRADRSPVDAIFRAAHTIKGNSAFLDLYALADVTHALEDLLHGLRDGRLAPDDGVMEGLFAGFDAVTKLFERVRAGEKPAEAPPGILRRLEALAKGEAPPPAPPPVPADAGDDAGDDAEAAPAPSAASSGDAALPAETPAPATRAAEETLRVRVGHLNRLIEHIGELVTISSGLQLVDRRVADPDLSRLHLRMGKALRNLRDLSLSLRMLPVAQLFDRFPRLVRDLAKRTGKKARLEAAGGDAELDRNIIEELYDPLMHLVRNCVDHGIEPPELRRASGKEECGVIRMAACHRENHVVIEVSDDGLGIDHEAVLRKAAETGIVAAGAAPSLSLDDIIHLIFEPGFSTKGEVTDLSGRGVGMDVVRARVEALHGVIAVSSVPGSGTRFELRLPLTLAILQVLLVEAGGGLFGLPLLSVAETAKYDPAAVEREPGYEFLNFRGETVRLAPLERVLGRPGDGASCRHVVLIRHGERRVGLAVERLGGKCEVVLKPVGGWLGRVRGVMGAAVLGDGRLVPILEIGALLREHLHD